MPKTRMLVTIRRNSPSIRMRHRVMSLLLINGIVGKQCFQLCLSVYRGFPILNCSNLLTWGTAPNPGPLPSPYRVPIPLPHTHVQT